MTFLPRLDERGADALMSQVRTECESFGTTCIGADGVCSVCAGPSGPDDTCPRCRDDRDAYGDELADLVVPLAYTVASGGGAHHFRSYKTSDRDRSRTVLGRLLRAALHLHGPCLETRLGRRLTTWTAVPSRGATARDPRPLLAVGRGGGLVASPAHLVESAESEADRVVDARRFRVRRELPGEKVLILGDAWVTGSSAQSAALAVRRAGATHVAIVALGRRLDPGHPPTAEFVDRRLAGGYDPTVCPVGVCAA